MKISDKKEVPQKPRFYQFDCVVLKRDIEGTVLKKGDVGAIMDVYQAKDGNHYDVDFTEKRELTSVPENALKIDFRVQPKRGKIVYASEASQPPPVLEKKADESV